MFIKDTLTLIVVRIYLKGGSTIDTVFEKFNTKLNGEGFTSLEWTSPSITQFYKAQKQTRKRFPNLVYYKGAILDEIAAITQVAEIEV